MYGGPYEPAALSSSREPLVVFVGRHISQKRAPVIPAAIARARRERPELRAVIFGDGPERGRVLEEIRRLGLEESVRAPGFAPWEEVDAHLRRAACLILPSRREGYGLAVVEASARGTPSIVTRAADNAATELVEDGVNGIVATGADPETLGRAIVDVLSRNDALVASTTAWFGKNAARLAIEASIPRVEAVYTEVAGAKDRAS
jgi:glycosyltransferase involved in cell wall biosynthesis